MRVLHVHQQAGFFGGVERILHDTAAGLAAEGWSQALLHESPSTQPRFLSAFNASGRDPRTLISAFRPHVVLIHKLENPERLEALADRHPCVRMVHDHDTVCLRRHKYFPLSGRICEHPAGWQCYRHLCFVQRSGGRFPIGFRGLADQRRLIQANYRMRALVVGSRWMARSLLVNGFDGQRVVVIPPVPASLGEIQALPASGGSEILYAGQVVRGKGVDLLLRALSGLKTSWHATVVGTGNHLSFCRQLARKLGIGQRVAFTGWVDHEQLQHYYGNALFTVVPSRWPEPFGMVGIEAMARGRAVVGFTAGGIPDWLEDGRSGLLVPAGDVAALGRAMGKLLAEPELARQMGVAAAARVAERFDYHRYLQQMKEILETAACA